MKWLSIVDEYTRECLCLKGSRRITSRDVIEVLQALFVAHGLPQHIRSDNGPEFIAKALRAWLELTQVGTLHVEPGGPRENGYAESFHSKVRDEFLNCEVFGSERELDALASIWRQEYNEVRPHSSLGYQTPAEFSRSCSAGATAQPERATSTTEVVNLSP